MGECQAEEQAVQMWGWNKLGARGRGRPVCQDSRAGLEARVPAPASTPYAASLCQGQLTRVNQMRFDRNRGQSDGVLLRRGQSDVVCPQGAQNHIQVAGPLRTPHKLLGAQKRLPEGEGRAPSLGKLGTVLKPTPPACRLQRAQMVSPLWLALYPAGRTAPSTQETLLNGQTKITIDTSELNPATGKGQ